MAKQLEEALKRPAQAPKPVPVEEPRVEAVDSEPPAPVPPPQQRPNGPELPAGEERIPEQNRGSSVEPPRPANEPARPAPVPTSPPPAAPAAAKDVKDPFSVEDIEAEFARLLGRPADKS